MVLTANRSDLKKILATRYYVTTNISKRVFDFERTLVSKFKDTLLRLNESQNIHCFFVKSIFLVTCKTNDIVGTHCFQCKILYICKKSFRDFVREQLFIKFV
jgi:hypothetical protein